MEKGAGEQAWAISRRHWVRGSGRAPRPRGGARREQGWRQWRLVPLPPEGLQCRLSRSCSPEPGVMEFSRWHHYGQKANEAPLFPSQSAQLLKQNAVHGPERQMLSSHSSGGGVQGQGLTSQG